MDKDEIANLKEIKIILYKEIFLLFEVEIFLLDLDLSSLVIVI